MEGGPGPKTGTRARRQGLRQRQLQEQLWGSSHSCCGGGGRGQRPQRGRREEQRLRCQQVRMHGPTCSPPPCTSGGRCGVAVWNVLGFWTMLLDQLPVDSHTLHLLRAWSTDLVCHGWGMHCSLCCHRTEHQPSRPQWRQVWKPGHMSSRSRTCQFLQFPSPRACACCLHKKGCQYSQRGPTIRHGLSPACRVHPLVSLVLRV